MQILAYKKWIKFKFGGVFITRAIEYILHMCKWNAV